MRLEDFLAEHCEKRFFNEDELIFPQKEVAESAFYIIEGVVQIFQGLDEKEFTLACLGQGEIFGEMSLLRFDEYTLSARATSNTEVYVIEPQLLHEQIRNTHPLVKAILDMLIDRIHNVNEILIDLDKANRA